MKRVVILSSALTLLLAAGLAAFVFAAAPRAAATTATPTRLRATGTVAAAASATAAPPDEARATLAVATTPTQATTRQPATPTAARTTPLPPIASPTQMPTAPSATVTRSAPTPVPVPQATTEQVTTASTVTQTAQSLLALGKEQLRNGDGEAGPTFQMLIDRYASSAEAVEARYRLGESQVDNHQEAAGADTLLAFAKSYPDHALARPALILAALGLRRIDHQEQALELYRRYLQQGGDAAGYVTREMAATYVEADQKREAIGAYESLLSSDIDADYLQPARRSIAELYTDLKDVDQAITWWGRVDAATSSTRDKALVLDKVAALQDQAGRADAAKDARLKLVTGYPSSAYAFDAMEALKRLGEQFTSYQQGVVYYYSYHNLEAIAAFLSHLATAPDGEQAAQARYRLGILYQRLEKYDLAIAALTDFHDRYPDNDLARDAWLEIARTLDLQGKRGDAAAFYEKIAAWYPQSTEGEQALWLASKLYYRLGRYSVTAQLLGKLRERFPNSAYLVRGTFWQGKSLLASGQGEQAAQVLAGLAATKRLDFYGLRTRQMLGQEPLVISAPDPDERGAFIRWMTGWAGAGPGPDITQDAHLRRGELLWQMHMPGEAASEMALARAAFSSDPWALLQLAERLRSEKITFYSILAAQRLFALSPAAFAEAPRYLLRLLYPADFSELVRSSAARYGVDAMWLFALMWQESGFNQYAGSTAGAMGLTQFMPPTAQSTARSLNVAGFHDEDLFRPRLSVQFGAWLLAQLTKAADGNILIALAGYNAGQGSAARWAKSQQVFDQDVYVEDVTFAETQTYLRAVYVYYYVYSALWGTR